MPTRNEAANIQPLLAGLGGALAGLDAEVLIVDDSDDATPDIARRAAMLPVLPREQAAGGPPGARS